MAAHRKIEDIYADLNARYARISSSTINALLKGKIKVRGTKTELSTAHDSSPSIEEAEDAFKKYNCAIFTAFRGGYTLEQNLERNASLKADMDELGMYYRPVRGCYKEAGMEYPDIEYCFFTFDKERANGLDFFAKAYSLSEKYDQESFLYKRGGINKAAFLIATNDDAREYLNGDISFTGQYFSHVEDVIAWTDCSDGRFSFMMKGMILINTNHKRVKFGEGDVFDTSGYEADGIIVIAREEHKDVVDGMKKHTSTPIAKHIFKNDNQTGTAIHDALIRAFKVMKDNKCKKIGIYCSAKVDDSFTEGAKIAYKTIVSWSERNPKKHQWIVIADKYGDYSKMLKETK